MRWVKVNLSWFLFLMLSWIQGIYDGWLLQNIVCHNQKIDGLFKRPSDLCFLSALFKLDDDS